MLQVGNNIQMRVTNVSFFTQVKKGVKRKADTTTPTAVPSQYQFTDDLPELPHTPGRPSKIATRRESGRQIKPPKRELPEAAQHQKGKKSKLTTSLKYCANILKEMLSKKHAVSDQTFLNTSLK